MEVRLSRDLEKLIREAAPYATHGTQRCCDNDARTQSQQQRRRRVTGKKARVYAGRGYMAVEEGVGESPVRWDVRRTQSRVATFITTSTMALSRRLRRRAARSFRVGMRGGNVPPPERLRKQSRFPAP